MTTLILLWLVGGVTPHTIKVEGFPNFDTCNEQGYRWKAADVGRGFVCISVPPAPEPHLSFEEASDLAMAKTDAKFCKTATEDWEIKAFCKTPQEKKSIKYLEWALKDCKSDLDQFMRIK